ncbi:hypothetical protein ACQ3I4_00360 [Zafaria sp. Z1313]|uniref:hypothetical protein n=1 Tax=unclassified Zafaria TaxID=2828765 RepID=UPI002E78A1FD|nr:hypothetical protein [Zafaria sp. J156]MEE1619838.1 hypothetical protein [Zafaria sp. J156]
MDQHIIVTVDEDHAEDVEGVAARLRGLGMQVESVLGSLGMVSGSADDSCRPALEAVDGVASIDIQQDVQIAPPDSSVQ